MHLSENYILLLSFITTVSFVIIKFSKQFKIFLDEYSAKIANKLTESEKMKNDAMHALKDVQLKQQQIDNQISDILLNAKKNTDLIFNNNIKEIEHTAHFQVNSSKENLNKIKDNIIDDIKKNSINILFDAIKDYVATSKKSNNDDIVFSNSLMENNFDDKFGIFDENNNKCGQKKTIIH